MKLIVLVNRSNYRPTPVKNMTSRLSNRFFTTSMTVFLPFIVAGCGQYGPLILPATQATTQIDSTSPSHSHINTIPTVPAYPKRNQVVEEN